MSTGKQYCTFYVCGLFLGIDVKRVQEVIRYQQMTRIPLAERTVKGLINLRGQIVSALDMRERLGFNEPRKGPAMNVVVRADDGGAICLMVDEIGDVVEIDEALRERPPETLDPRARELISCVYKLPKSLLLVLNEQRVVDIPSGAHARDAA